MFRLNRKGKTSGVTKSMLGELNSWLENQDDTTKYRYSQRQYNTVSELEDVYEEIFGKKPDSAIQDAKIVSESTTPINNSSTVSSNSGGIADSLSDDIPDFDFDPNSSNVKSRLYNQQTTDPTMTSTVGEPVYQAEEIPTPENPNPTGGTPNAGATSSGKKDDEPKSTLSNPALNEADEKTKRIAAEQLVDTFLGLYGAAHEWVKPLAKLKEKSIIELEKKGIIDPNETVPIDENGNEVNARQFLHITNKTIDDILSPDPTFNAKVRPPMIREFSKRGWGMTDMQTIIVLFAQDIATKGGLVIGLRKQNTDIVQMFKDMHKEKMAKFESLSTPNPTSVKPDSIRQAPLQNESVLDDNTAFEPHTEEAEVI